MEQQQPKSCDVCGAPSTFVCSRCKDVKYCSKACQVKNWPLHKIDCRTPEARANQVELVEGMKALLEEFGDVGSGGTEGWTYDEDDEKAGGSSSGKAGGRSKTLDAAKGDKRKAAAAALLSQFIPPEGEEVSTEEGGASAAAGDGGKVPGK